MKKLTKSNEVTVKNISSNEFTRRLDIFVKQIMEYVDTRLRVVENNQAKMMITLDWLVGAFKKFDDEHMLLTGNYSKIRETLDEHESRLAIMEKRLSYQPKK